MTCLSLHRIGFNADPDPAFFLKADPDTDPGQTLPSQKVGFDMKNILYVGVIKHT